VESGSYDYFVEAILGHGGKMRSYSSNSDDNALVGSVAGNKGAISFFGASYYFGNQDKVKALKIVNPKTQVAVLPTRETIESGEYSPLSRPLFIYVNLEKLKQPQVRVFVEEYLKLVPELAGKVGYVPLPEEIYDRANANFKERKAGTHFVDADGNSRSGSLEAVYKPENLLSN
jgi:phosphate transport system substrate-binding protein